MREIDPASRLPVELLALLSVASILIVPHGASGGSLLLAATALVLALGRGERWTREDRLMVFAPLFFVVVSVSSYLIADPAYEGLQKLGRHARIALCPLILMLAWRAGLREGALWWGAVVGSVGACVKVLIALASSSPELIIAQGYGGNTQPAQFGGLALLLAFLSLTGAGYFRRHGRWALLIPILAFVAGVVASLLSGSRGVWIAFAMLAVFLLWSVRALREAQRLALLALLVLVMAAAYLVPQTGVATSLAQLIAEVGGLLSGETELGAVGLRMQMWGTAWQLFLESPLTGVGVGGYLEGARALVADGSLDPAILRYSHPHSEFLLVAATRGLLGLLALGLLFGIPLRQFHWGLDHPDATVRRLARAGFVVVLAFLGLALVEAVFDRTISASFFATALGLTWGMLRAREDAVLAEGPQRRETIAVAVITRDEADRIADLLGSVHGWADEIVVMDSGSTDDTVAIARRYTDQVIETDWPGYGKQKQRVAAACGSDWILSLDADEVPSERLKAEIDAELDGERGYDAYRFPWASEVFGDLVYFGADGRLHLRLFRRAGPARFNDAAVHEGVIPAGRLRTLHGHVEHRTFRDFQHLLQKFASYARIQARDRYSRGRRSGVIGATLRGVASFLLLYLLRLGVLDGRRGLLMAMLYAGYTFDKYAALWVIEQDDQEREQA